jgi:hypothetical protein
LAEFDGGALERIGWLAVPKEFGFDGGLKFDKQLRRKCMWEGSRSLQHMPSRALEVPKQSSSNFCGFESRSR